MAFTYEPFILRCRNTNEIEQLTNLSSVPKKTKISNTPDGKVFYIMYLNQCEQEQPGGQPNGYNYQQPQPTEETSFQQPQQQQETNPFKAQQNSNPFNR